MSGRRRSTTQQSNARRSQRVERVAARGDRRQSRCRRGRAARRCSARSISLSSIDQQALACAARRRSRRRSSALSSSSVVAGLTRYEKAPCDRPCWRSSSTDSICTGMWRGAGVELQVVQHGPAQHVGQEHVERDRGRGGTRAPAAAPAGRAVATIPLNPLLARHAEQDPRIVRVVLDDQQTESPGGCPRGRRRSTPRLDDGQDRDGRVARGRRPRAAGRGGSRVPGPV